MARVGLGCVWLSVAMALVAFFLPWVTLDVHAPEGTAQLGHLAGRLPLVDALTRTLGKVAVRIQHGAEEIIGELPAVSDSPTHLSGVAIPRVAQQPNIRAALAITGLLTNTRYDLRMTRLVYLVPGIACLCGLVLTACIGQRVIPRPVTAPYSGASHLSRREVAFGDVTGRRIIVRGVGSLCALIAGVGCWTILTMTTQFPAVTITIGPGVWWSLGAYAGLAVSAGLCAGRTSFA